jgi:hypothetical protein
VAKRKPGPPDFVGVGTQRSGTTWWFSLLLDHPRIRGPHGARKEVHHFDRFGAEPMTDADITAYHEFFARRPGMLAGEWTPRYMAYSWTPEVLRRAAPEAKLLVLLRDPIERFRSGIAHRSLRGPQRGHVTASDALERGRYASQLRHLYDTFDREQVLVLQYERCRTDPIAQYRRTLEFIGADDHVPAELERPRGRPIGEAKEPLQPHMEEGLHSALDHEVLELREFAPEIDISLWPNFAHLVAHAGS